MRMVARILAGISAVALAGIVPATAETQQPPAEPPPGQACAPLDVVAANLAGSYHEQPVARAIGGQGDALMVVFASPGGATWTAVAVRAKDHVACIVAAGTDWQLATPEPEGPAL